jgi:hypothetical protein
MVAVLAALKDPDGVAAAAGVAAGVVVGVVAGVSVGADGVAAQTPAVTVSSNPVLQDLKTEFPGQVHVTAVFAIASHAVHTNETTPPTTVLLELDSKPSSQTAMVVVVAEEQVIELAFAIAVQAVHASPAAFLKKPSAHVNSVAAVTSVHVYMALATGEAAAVQALQVVSK